MWTLRVGTADTRICICVSTPIQDTPGFTDVDCQLDCQSGRRLWTGLDHNPQDAQPGPYCMGLWTLKVIIGIKQPMKLKDPN